MPLGVSVSSLKDLGALRKSPAFSAGEQMARLARIRIGRHVVMLNHDTKLYPHHIDDTRSYDFGAPVAEMSTGTIICQGGGCPGEVQSFYLASHDVRLGFRYILPTLTPPPPPLIRKY